MYNVYSFLSPYYPLLFVLYFKSIFTNNFVKLSIPSNIIYVQLVTIYKSLQVCKILEESQTRVQWSEEQQVPYLVYRDMWVGFDNEKSFKIKVIPFHTFKVIFDGLYLNKFR